jgi:16S rRNA C1402 (ribose-2'-O) methylase RsmI
MHEEMLIGTASEHLKTLTVTPVKQKGEFVIVVDTN